MIPRRIEGDEVVALAPDGKPFAGRILEVDDFEGERCYMVASVDDEGQLDDRIGESGGECCAERHLVEGWGLAKPKMTGDESRPLRRSRKVHYFTERRSLCLGWIWRGNGDNLREQLTEDQVQKGAFCARCKRLSEDREKERNAPLLEVEE